MNSTSKPAKTIVILQSNYIPWKGYFDLMSAADEFLIFDEVQYTRRDWRNRNKIVLAGTLQWLTIPVQSKGNYDAPIDQMEIADPSWSRSHWNKIVHSYRRAPYFGAVAPRLEATYDKAAGLSRLTEVNEVFLRVLAGFLSVDTLMLRTSTIPRTAEDPTARLVEICVARGATTYISGPAAKAYIDKSQFDAVGIELKYANYSGYPIYDQGSETFEHGVSIVDVLMRCGADARGHLKSLRDRNSFLDAA